MYGRCGFGPVARLAVGSLRAGQAVDRLVSELTLPRPVLHEVDGGHRDHSTSAANLLEVKQRRR